MSHRGTVLLAWALGIGTMAPAEGALWRVRQTVHFRFHFTEAQRSAALDLADWLEEKVPTVSQVVGHELGERTNLYLFPTYEEFEEVSGGELDPWVVGLAVPHRRLIWLPPQRSRAEFRVVALHEWAHVAWQAAVGEAESPPWLHEGVAKYLSRDFTLADRRLLEQAAASGTLLSLEELNEGFPHDAARASLAYAESYTFVDFLLQRFGPEALGRLARPMRTGCSLEEAVEQALGVDLLAFQAEWFAHLRQTYRRQALWGSLELVIFAAMALLTLMAFLQGLRLRWARWERLEDWE